MAKLTRAVCDFCGGALGTPHATLTVPLPSNAAAKITPNDPENAYRLFVATWTVGPASSDRARSFDMCNGCAEGLTKWRHAAIEKLLESGFVKED